MTGVEQIWRAETVDEVAKAAADLSGCTRTSQRAIRAEPQRRGLPARATVSDEGIRRVFVRQDPPHLRFSFSSAGTASTS